MINDSDVALEKQKLLARGLKEKEVLVDGKTILPVSLSPYIIDCEKYNRLSSLCEEVSSAIEKVLRVYVKEEKVQALFPELERYRDLSCIAPKYKNWIHLGRFDLVEVTEGKFKILETNCDCPGGILFAPLIKKIFKEFNLVKSCLFHSEEYQNIDSEIFFINSLISVFKRYFPDKIPNIGFLSSSYRSITSDLNLLEKIGKQMGLNCSHEEIQNLIKKNGLLSTKDFSLDLVYQKFDAFIDNSGQAKPCIYDLSYKEVRAYWDAIQNGNVLSFNSFPSALVAENKRILELLNMGYLFRIIFII